jgi:hypothetical protein
VCSGILIDGCALFFVGWITRAEIPSGHEDDECEYDYEEGAFDDGD